MAPCRQVVPFDRDSQTLSSLAAVMEHLPRDERWKGQFTLCGIPLVVACRLADSTVCFFSGVDDSRLMRDGVVVDALLA